MSEIPDAAVEAAAEALVDWYDYQTIDGYGPDRRREFHAARSALAAALSHIRSEEIDRLQAERDHARADVSHLETAICDALEGLRQRWPMVRVEEVLRSAIAATAHPRRDER